MNIFLDTLKKMTHDRSDKNRFVAKNANHDSLHFSIPTLASSWRMNFLASMGLKPFYCLHTDRLVAFSSNLHKM